MNRKFILLSFFLCAPVYACKMLPLNYDAATLKAALEEIAKQTPMGKIRSLKNSDMWIIEITEGKSCYQYRVETKMPGKNGCEIKAEIMAKSPCSNQI